MKSTRHGRIVSLQTGEVDLSKNGTPTSIAELKLRNRDRNKEEREPEVFNMQETQNKNIQRSGEAIASAFLNRKYGKSPEDSKKLLEQFPLDEQSSADFTPPPMEDAPKQEDLKVNTPEAKKESSIFYLGESLKIKKVEPIPKNLGPHTKRLPLLSKGLYTSFDSIYVRPFSFPEFCYLQAAMENKDESAILDVFNMVISENVRSLLNKDFTYIQYWLRLNSLPSTPIPLSWTSVYGNKNTYQLKENTLQANISDATLEQRDKYPMFSFPTVGDRENFRIAVEEIVANGDNPSAFKALVKRAQYLKGDDLAEKIELAKTLPPEILMIELPKFIKEMSDFGVKEEFTTTDQHFKAEEAIEVLTFKAAAAQERIEEIESYDTYREDVVDLKGLQADIVEDLSRIETELKNTGEAAPKSETRQFSFDLADFFPQI